MTTKDTSEPLVALESFIGGIDGVERVFRAGDLIRPTDAAVKKWPDKFGPARFGHEPRLEQATAAPGEKRG